MNELWDLSLRTGIPALALILGAVLVQISEPSAKLRATCQHFGAGILTVRPPTNQISSCHASILTICVVIGGSAGRYRV